MKRAALLLGIVTLAGCMGPSAGVLYDPARDKPKDVPARRWRPSLAGVSDSWRVPSSGVWRYVVLHHSATEVGGAVRFDREHRDRISKDGLGYHFVIGNGSDTGDGEVEVGCRWKTQMRGAHCGDPYYNAHGVGICLVGNFESHPPSERQMEALETLVKYLQVSQSIPTSAILLHRHIKNTLCPGRLFPYRTLLAKLDGVGSEPVAHLGK